MTQAARRRRTQPTLTPPPAPPGPPGPPVEDEAALERAEAKTQEDEWVTCFLSGERILKRQAVMARIGPGRSMWIARTLTAEGAPDPRPTWR
jgi:hypothetical protein